MQLNRVSEGSLTTAAEKERAAGIDAEKQGELQLAEVGYI